MSNGGFAPVSSLSGKLVEGDDGRPRGVRTEIGLRLGVREEVGSKCCRVCEEVR